MIEEIYIYQFRNLLTLNITLNSKNIILAGANGAGKSNFLEAIYYLCLGASFRERYDRHIVAFEKDSFSLIGKHSIDNYFDKVKIQFIDDEKKIEVNEVGLRDRKELLMRYPCVTFSYDDLRIVDGEPSLRRQFFDQAATLMFGDSYLVLLRSYQRMIKQRNKAFKEHVMSFIEATDDEFVQLNDQISHLRDELMVAFNGQMIKLSQQLLGKELFFAYRKSIRGSDKQAISKFLEQKRSYEVLKKSVLFGVHRDRYDVIDEWGKEQGSYLSIGQKRLVALMMKQILSHFVLLYRKRRPIILLDDVFVELDQSNRQKFWQLLPEYEQLFMSELSEEVAYHELSSYRLYRIESGQIEIVRER